MVIVTAGTGLPDFLICVEKYFEILPSLKFDTQRFSLSSKVNPQGPFKFDDEAVIITDGAGFPVFRISFLGNFSTESSLKSVTHKASCRSKAS